MRRISKAYSHSCKAKHNRIPQLGGGGDVVGSAVPFKAKKSNAHQGLRLTELTHNQSPAIKSKSAA